MDVVNRTDLAKYFYELGFTVGAEIGVAEGAYSFILCKEIPGLKLFCVDPWDTMSGINHDHRLRQAQRVRRLLSPYNASLIKKYSWDALSDIADNSLDFVYIDAGHFFDEVILDIIGWSKKVRKGGIVSGHDYNSSDLKRVATAVDAYVKAHRLTLRTTTDPREPLSWWFHKKWNI